MGKFSGRTLSSDAVLSRNQQPPVLAVLGRVDRLVDALDNDDDVVQGVVVVVDDEAFDALGPML